MQWDHNYRIDAATEGEEEMKKLLAVIALTLVNYAQAQSTSAFEQVVKTLEDSPFSFNVASETYLPVEDGTETRKMYSYIYPQLSYDIVENLTFTFYPRLVTNENSLDSSLDVNRLTFKVFQTGLLTEERNGLSWDHEVRWNDFISGAYTSSNFQKTELNYRAYFSKKLNDKFSLTSRVRLFKYLLRDANSSNQSDQIRSMSFLGEYRVAAHYALAPKWKLILYSRVEDVKAKEVGSTTSVFLNPTVEYTLNDALSFSLDLDSLTYSSNNSHNPLSLTPAVSLVLGKNLTADLQVSYPLNKESGKRSNLSQATAQLDLNLIAF